MCLRCRRGSALVEFTLVGIPLIFVIISVFEMARGMWNYHTLQEAVKEGVRFEAVRGYDLVMNPSAGNTCNANPDSCGASVRGVARALAAAAIGIPPQHWNAVLIAGTHSHTCAPVSSCFGNMAQWPPGPPQALTNPTRDNAVGTPIEIRATYTFTSALAMFFPGSQGMSFATATFAADSQQSIVY